MTLDIPATANPYTGPRGPYEGRQWLEGYMDEVARQKEASGGK